MGDQYRNGLDLVECQPMSTGYYKLDSLLKGGIGRGELLELFGESGTGKTQMCMHIASHFVRTRKETVLYLDCKNDLAPNRLFQVMKMDPASMRRVRIVRVSKAESVMSVFQHFDEEISTGQSIYCSKLRLLVIDSLPSIIYPWMGRGGVGRSVQETLSQDIKKFAQRHGVACLMVNNSVSVYERGMRGSGSDPQKKRFKPAMGKYWVQIPHLRIFLQRDTGFRAIIRATLDKSSTRAEVEKSFDFTITESGIE